MLIVAFNIFRTQSLSRLLTVKCCGNIARFYFFFFQNAEKLQKNNHNDCDERSWKKLFTAAVSRLLQYIFKAQKDDNYWEWKKNIPIQDRFPYLFCLKWICQFVPFIVTTTNNHPIIMVRLNYRSTSLIGDRAWNQCLTAWSKQM